MSSAHPDHMPRRSPGNRQAHVLSLEGQWPEPYEVCRDEARRKLVLRTRFYSVEHDLRQGGAISSIVFFHGSGENLLIAPMASRVVSAAGAGADDLRETDPICRVVESAADVRVTMEGRLLAAPKTAGAPASETLGDAGLRYRTTYVYRWGYIRIHREFLFPEGGFPVSQVLVHEQRLRPDLGHYGVRSGAPAKDATDCGEFDWGRLRPGAAFDYPYRSRYVPRHVIFGNPGREGLEWFSSSDLAQWTHDVCGECGYGELWIGPQSSPCTAAVLRISALLLPRPDLRRRDWRLTGTKTFNFTIGLPLLSGRAHRPFLHRSFNRKNWPSEETLRSWANQGVKTAHFHHDGDTFRDGVFWRDGIYPPFGQEDMAEFDRVIATCHRHGIRVATYFSNKELHPSTEAFRKHGREWARLPDGETIVHNPYSGDEYGGQMCLRSGWIEFFKTYVDTVLSHHALDGVYYDWNQAIICNNPAHTSRAVGQAQARETLLPDTPAAHWDMDELIELMEWTRRRVGRDGLVIIHNTMNPCAATENFADYVVAMEWGCGQLSLRMPPLDDLPLEWSFFGSRSRALIVGGCLDRNAAETLRRQMVLCCLLTGVAPWQASDLVLEMFAPLSRQELSGCRFLDWRHGAAATDHSSVAAAVYDRCDRALIVLANLSERPATANVRLIRGVLSLMPAASYRMTDLADGQETDLAVEAVFERGWPVLIAVDACRILRIEVRPSS